MPHATGDEMEIDEDSEIAKFLQNQEASDSFLGADHQFDQTDKADDAIDYEDLDDDDDLPEEEEATHRLDDEGSDGARYENGFAGLPETLPYTNGTNGYHAKEPSSDDALFGEAGGDPFFSGLSSPEQDRRPPSRTQPPPQRPGLALPTKSGLALPGVTSFPPSRQPSHQRPQARRSQSSFSPPTRHDEFGRRSASTMAGSDEEDETAGMDDMTKQQMLLFRRAKRKRAGEEVQDDGADADMSRFWALFPDYEGHQNPRFTDLFPQRPVHYRGKVPPKPPKPVQPTKLAIDLLPDQERSFKSAAAAKHNNEVGYAGRLISLQKVAVSDDDSDDGRSVTNTDEEELIGGLSMEDLALICQDWAIPSIQDVSDDELVLDDWDAHERTRPAKKPKLDILNADLSTSLTEHQLAFDEPERAVAKLAKHVALDLNDPNLMVDEHAPQTSRKTKRIPGDDRRDAALARDLAKRYNISNDEAYDLLKENHQHKVRSLLGATSIEHSLPAAKLQYPFYKVSLDPKTKRSFHRPALDLRMRYSKEEFKISKLKTVKKRDRKGKDIKEIFATAESLALNDNANVLLLEYSEEAPMMLSNFGMGNRLINYYRKRNPDDQERPKREIGELNVLLTQDKSPFSNFGHVDQGEVVPTLQNALFRAPVFEHQPKPTDFLVAISTTHSYGSRMYLRNMEHLHTVGQQFPISEVPTEHSRRVTDAAKKRLRAIAYRIYNKSQDPSRKNAKPLNNATIMAHLKGHDMPQTRSKMREFMAYDKGNRDELGVWVPKPGHPVPDLETLRTWLKPEEICLLDSMQVGVQRLTDLGLSASTKGGADEEEKDADENENIEVRLAPWAATKNFLQATQGKAMLQLHGEGDPTGRGEGFSFLKTSMKGGFQPVGESVEDRLDAKKRREDGGHRYNVAKQQKAYDGFIRQIWEKQKTTLSSNIEFSDIEMEDDIDAEPESAGQGARGATPRSSFAGTPAAFGRRDDETGTQFSRGSVTNANSKVLVVERRGKDGNGNETEIVETITNPRVIREYKRRRNERRLEAIPNLFQYKFDGQDPDLDALVFKKLEEEKARIQRNADRREARERLKNSTAGTTASSPPASQAGSPGPSDADADPRAQGANGSTDVTPQKGRGRNKDGTARKCANCGQVGHIKTNRKSVSSFICLHCDAKNKINPDGTIVVAGSTGKSRAGHASPAPTATSIDTRQQPSQATTLARAKQNSYSTFNL
jgi:transcription initiation factor TFIID subunit 1, fungi type